MIDLPKAILAKAKSTGDTKFIEEYIMNHYPIPVIIKSYAELIVVSDDIVNKPQIIVSEEEYETITSLFKIRGQRMVDGEVVKERRGRPRLNKEDM